MGADGRPRQISVEIDPVRAEALVPIEPKPGALRQQVVHRRILLRICIVGLDEHDLEELRPHGLEDPKLSALR